MKRPFRRRLNTRRSVPATVLAALALAAALAGCSERSPIQSTEPYDPVDGVTANMGALAVRDLLVVSAGKGQVGVVSGALINSGTSDLTVTFTAQGDSTTPSPVTVPAGQLVRLGSGDGASNVQFATVSAAPGALLSVRVSTPPTGPRVLDVPVLSPTLEYSTITPTPEPTTSSPTPSATPA